MNNIGSKDPSASESEGFCVLRPSAQRRSSQVESKRGSIVPIIESRLKSSAAVEESSAAIEKSQKIREK